MFDLELSLIAKVSAKLSISLVPPAPPHTPTRHTLCQLFQTSSSLTPSSSCCIICLRLVSGLADSGRSHSEDSAGQTFAQGVDRLHQGCVQLVVCKDVTSGFRLVVNCATSFSQTAKNKLTNLLSSVFKEQLGKEFYLKSNLKTCQVIFKCRNLSEPDVCVVTRRFLTSKKLLRQLLHVCLAGRVVRLHWVLIKLYASSSSIPYKRRPHRDFS